MTSAKALKGFLLICLSAAFISSTAWAGDDMPDAQTYIPSLKELMKEKALVDDPKDLIETYHPKDTLPPEVWNYMHFDVNEMKKKTAEIMGFTAPEKVGRIAPEIKPGKYTYKDLDKNPSLKELFPPTILRNIKAGGPPLSCMIQDFEIAPTVQFHWSLPICEATIKNLGKTRLDKDGYRVAFSWDGGVPFPRPSGKFEAQQVYYNFEKRAHQWDFSFLLTTEAYGLNRNLKIDNHMKMVGFWCKMMGRVFLPPFGWLDERAKENGEYKAYSIVIKAPRVNRGTITLRYEYDDPYKMDVSMIYVPSLRRIRKMGVTDTQDPQGDMTYDDTNFLSQKVTPKKFPYKFSVEKREYLLPFANNTSKAWVDSKSGYALRDLQFQRRPTYVLTMQQQDPNYSYSKRVYYIDAETFQPVLGVFYDQRGQLYRSYMIAYTFIPECGQITSYGQTAVQTDYIDEHTTFQMLVYVPASWDRRYFTIQHLVRYGK